MKSLVVKISVGLAILLVAVYAADYCLLRYRVAANRNAFGTITVRSYYAVGEKNNKTEYVFKSQADQTCVHSVFSHLGYTPCWYLSRHSETQITI
jgi:hypothetical protein